VRRALERKEAERWAELNRPLYGEQPDFGIGVAYFQPGVNGTPPVVDTLVLRARAAWDAPQVARFIFSMPANDGWTYTVLAPGGEAASNLLEFGYEEAGLPIDSILPDSSWLRLLYAGRRGDVQRGWVPLHRDRLAYLLWSQTLPERAQFFIRDEDVQFFAEAGGAPVSFPLARTDGTGYSRLDYHLEPDSVMDDWLRVRVVTPSNACIAEPGPVRDTTLWVRYLNGGGRPVVWYHTRGC
jgi:hypothetical protein